MKDAQELGFVGPGSLDDHLRHGIGFAQAVEGLLPPASGAPKAGPQSPPLSPLGRTVDLEILDLGSGAGLPGLVLACRWSHARLALADAAQRRVDFLRHAAERLDVSDRVEILHGRAEVLGRRAAVRGRFDVVVARSFGPPAVTAECASPFLRVGGHLVTSEPPPKEDADERWPPQGLSTLGMGPSWVVAGAFGFRVVPQLARTPDRYPRREGVPAKRPLF